MLPAYKVAGGLSRGSAVFPAPGGRRIHGRGFGECVRRGRVRPARKAGGGRKDGGSRREEREGERFASGREGRRKKKGGIRSGSRVVKHSICAAPPSGRTKGEVPSPAEPRCPVKRQIRTPSLRMSISNRKSRGYVRAPSHPTHACRSDLGASIAEEPCEATGDARVLDAPSPSHAFPAAAARPSPRSPAATGCPAVGKAYDGDFPSQPRRRYRKNR